MSRRVVLSLWKFTRYARCHMRPCRSRLIMTAPLNICVCGPCRTKSIGLNTFQSYCLLKQRKTGNVYILYIISEHSIPSSLCITCWVPFILSFLYHTSYIFFVPYTWPDTIYNVLTLYILPFYTLLSLYIVPGIFHTVLTLFTIPFTALTLVNTTSYEHIFKTI